MKRSRFSDSQILAILKQAENGKEFTYRLFANREHKPTGKYFLISSAKPLVSSIV